MKELEYEGSFKTNGADMTEIGDHLNVRLD